MLRHGLRKKQNWNPLWLPHSIWLTACILEHNQYKNPSLFQHCQLSWHRKSACVQRFNFRDIYKNQGQITAMGGDQTCLLDTDTATCISAQNPQVQHKAPQKFNTRSGSPHTLYLLELHLFSFFFLCPFQCWLVNMSKCSELWRLKERFIVTVCSQGF